MMKFNNHKHLDAAMQKQKNSNRRSSGDIVERMLKAGHADPFHLSDTKP